MGTLTKGKVPVAYSDYNWGGDFSVLLPQKLSMMQKQSACCFWKSASEFSGKNIFICFETNLQSCYLENVCEINTD